MRNGSLTTVVVVDDDAGVLSLVERVLTCAGYRVLTAKDGIDALNLCKASGRVDLLISDVDMPMMAGPDLVETVWYLFGFVRVLYISGRPLEGMGALHVRTGRAYFLPKPFLPLDLLTAMVRGILDPSLRTDLVVQVETDCL
jgi:two-component system, cell cycle sensor histidine kinase and response regulator CckA